MSFDTFFLNTFYNILFTLNHFNNLFDCLGVAQKVADKIALHHLKTFGVKHKSNRNDMTLIVRNINFPVLDKLPSTSYSGFIINRFIYISKYKL